MSDADNGRDVFQCIAKRRSMRKFDARSVPRQVIEQLLEAAILAPSGKNAQPWRFVVCQGQKKDELAAILAAKVDYLQSQGGNTGSAANSARIMAQAPVCILVYDDFFMPEDDHNEQRHWHLVQTQSIGAAIQNLLLAAEGLGLGSLWICDVFPAEQEIAAFAGRREELVAAVAIGYPADSPAPRPRKPLTEVVEWLE